MQLPPFFSIGPSPGRGSGVSYPGSILGGASHEIVDHDVVCRRDRFFIQGYFEHREMELMVQAGLTPMQVIQSFSKGASKALRIDQDFGTLARGKLADLLVLEKNPLENIANLRTIQAIYLGGRRFE